MTEGPSQERDQALRNALRTSWKTSEDELEALVPRPKEGHSTIRRMQAVLLIVVKKHLNFCCQHHFLHIFILSHYLITHSPGLLPTLQGEENDSAQWLWEQRWQNVWTAKGCNLFDMIGVIIMGQRIHAVPKINCWKCCWKTTLELSFVQKSKNTRVVYNWCICCIDVYEMSVMTRTTHCNDLPSRRWIESFTWAFTKSWFGIGLQTSSLRMESRAYRRIFVGLKSFVMYTVPLGRIRWWLLPC